MSLFNKYPGYRVTPRPEEAREEWVILFGGAESRSSYGPGGCEEGAGESDGGAGEDQGKPAEGSGKADQKTTSKD